MDVGASLSKVGPRLDVSGSKRGQQRCQRGLGLRFASWVKITRPVEPVELRPTETLGL